MPDIDLKILIDSGASNSVINSKPAFERFSDFIYNKPFVVSGLGSKIYCENNLNIPLFYEIGIQKPIHFHVVDWHEKFDALLGSSDLRKLGAKLDYKSNTLEICDISIPFYLEYTNKKIKPIKFNLNNFIKVPVTIENGDVIFPELKINENSTIPESLTTANNGYCIFPVDKQNNLEINFSERIEVTPLLEHEICNPPKNSQNFKLLDHIRLSHLNNEERNKIVKLCMQFKDIFYNENSDLTFSNTVKHEIRTKDEEPVYVKSFRHPHSMKLEIQKQIEKLLDDKIIRPSISPYSAPVWIVPKKTDASGKKNLEW